MRDFEAQTACYPSLELGPKELLLKADLETEDLEIQKKALEKILCMLQNGENIQGGLMIPIIRMVLPNIHYFEHRLLRAIFETISKVQMKETTLVCDAFREVLMSPVEFILGSTLQLLSNLKVPELLEPLIPIISKFLKHKETYVRGNALKAIYTIYKNYEFLIPEAPELIANFLDWEEDVDYQDYALELLEHTDQDRFLSYLSTYTEYLHNFWLSHRIVELLKRVCNQNPSERTRFFNCSYNLLRYSFSHVARFEAAGTLLTLSDDPDVIKAVISLYIEMLGVEIATKHTDCRLEVDALGRLVAMRDSPTYEKILAEQLMKILNHLNSRNLEKSRETLSVAMELITARNIEELVIILREEINKTSGINEEDITQYRQLLVSTLQCAYDKFPDQFSSDIIDEDKDFNPLEFVECMEFELQNELKIQEKRATAKENFKSLKEKIVTKMKMNKKEIIENKKIIAELEEKFAALKEKFECKICLTADVDLQFLPCHHLACTPCSQRISRCHICRENIEEKLRFFLS